jgi:tetraacyldisaccharide 4'-kinase
VNALERSWYQRFGWTWLLLPLSGLFGLLSSLRRLAFRLGVVRATKLPVPVIVVGNITVGGTGKTPLTLWLCQQLKQHGWRPGIISRGYGVQLSAPLLVQPAGSAADFGDEPLLLAQRSGCPVVIFPNRVAAGHFLLAHTDCDLIICDDGLQHYALQRDIEIILIDAARGLGNGLLLPAGPLREGRWRLGHAALVLANGRALPETSRFFTLRPEAAEQLLDASCNWCQAARSHWLAALAIRSGLPIVCVPVVTRSGLATGLPTTTRFSPLTLLPWPAPC